jgi:hypothetical protein
MTMAMWIERGEMRITGRLSKRDQQTWSWTVVEEGFVSPRDAASQLWRLSDRRA